MVQLSHPYVTTGITIALTIWKFVGKVISLLFNILSRFVIAFGYLHPISPSTHSSPLKNYKPALFFCEFVYF